MRSSDSGNDSTTENPDFTGLMQENNFTFGYDKVCKPLEKARMKHIQHRDLLNMCRHAPPTHISFIAVPVILVWQQY